jgi:hypothetical protein
VERLILPEPEPPRSGTLLDARGAKLRRFARVNQTLGRVVRLDETGEPIGESIELEIREVTIWD